MRKRLKLPQQLRFCQLVAQLLAAGFTLSQALDYLRVAEPKLAPCWRQVQAALVAGQPLATALEEAAFHPLIVNQVALAEVHGQLAQSLQHAGDYLRLQVANRRKLKQLLVYPAVLMTLLVSLQLVLWLGVLPSLAMTPGNSMRWELVGVVGFAGMLGLGGALLRHLSPVARLRLARRIPGVAALAVGYYQYQFVLGASHFLGAGQELSAYCQQLAELPAGVLQNVGAQVVAALNDGATLEQALAQPLIYPPLAELVRLGQPAKLVQAGVAMFASDLFAQLQQRFERGLALVQPVLFLAIGVQIVLVYMNLLGPLYNSVS